MRAIAWRSLAGTLWNLVEPCGTGEQPSGWGCASLGAGRARQRRGVRMRAQVVNVQQQPPQEVRRRRRRGFACDVRAVRAPAAAKVAAALSSGDGGGEVLQERVLQAGREGVRDEPKVQQQRLQLACSRCGRAAWRGAVRERAWGAEGCQAGVRACSEVLRCIGDAHGRVQYPPLRMDTARWGSAMEVARI